MPKDDVTPQAVATKPKDEKPKEAEVTTLKAFCQVRGMKAADLVDIDVTKNRGDIVTAMIEKCRKAKKAK